MSTSRQHALIASKLLDGETELDAALLELPIEKTLELAVSGGMRDLNRDREFSVQLAQAHAMTAIALAWNEDRDHDANQSAQRP